MTLHAQARPRAAHLDLVAIVLVVLGVAATVGGLAWTMAGGGALAQAACIGGSGIASIPIALRAMTRWGRPGATQDAAPTAGWLAAFVVAPAIAGLSAGIAFAVALAVPGGRAWVRAAQADPDSWLFDTDAVGAQLAITTLLPLIGGMSAALAAVLLVGLPWLALRRPDVAATGTTVDDAQQARQRLVLRLVMVGMSPLLLGIALWIGTGSDGIHRFPNALGWVLSDLSRGHVPHLDDLGFVLGVVLVVGGGASFAAGLALAVLHMVRAPGGR